MMTMTPCEGIAIAIRYSSEAIINTIPTMPHYWNGCDIKHIELKYNFTSK